VNNENVYTRRFPPLKFELACIKEVARMSEAISGTGGIMVGYRRNFVPGGTYFFTIAVGMLLPM
jgi:hypothetical protein